MIQKFKIFVGVFLAGGGFICIDVAQEGSYLL